MRAPGTAARHLGADPTVLAARLLTSYVALRAVGRVVTVEAGVGPGVTHDLVVLVDPGLRGIAIGVVARVAELGARGPGSTLRVTVGADRGGLATSLTVIFLEAGWVRHRKAVAVGAELRRVAGAAVVDLLGTRQRMKVDTFALVALLRLRPLPRPRPLPASRRSRELATSASSAWPAESPPCS